MEIKKTITLNLERKGNNFVCRDLPTLSMIMGTCAVSSNLHLYKIKKDKNKYIVPIEEVKKRLVKLQDDKQKLESKLEIIKQILK